MTNMSRGMTMTVQEYAEKHNVSERTVYRWIKDGKINAEKFHNTWIVNDEEGDCPDNSVNCPERNVNQQDNGQIEFLNKQIEQLKSENEYLRKKLDSSLETIDNQSVEREKSQERSDTIIMQLTRQLENQNRMLEDMRTRSLWKRVKTALGFRKIQKVFSS